MTPEDKSVRARQFLQKLLLPSGLAGLLGLYAYYILQSFSGHLFNPAFTAGDARQQLFAFFDAIDPEIFRGDLVALSVKSYIAPLHWQLGMFITRLTQDPIMTGHWMMAIQLGVTIFFTGASGFQIGGPVGGALSAAFLLHSRNLVRTTVAGLPRGWYGPVVAAFIYFFLKKNHWGVLAVIFLGTLLNPLGAFLSGLTYGAWLLFHCLSKNGRAEYLPHLKRAILAAPIIITANFFALRRPAEIGSMIGLRDAMKMEEFSRNNGRFEFLPFPPPLRELQEIGTRTISAPYGEKDPDALARGRLAASVLFVALILGNIILRGRLFPYELLAFLGAGVASYFAARILAFHLYVPERYLIWPPGLFIILALPAAFRRLAVGSSQGRSRAIKETLGCLFLIVLVVSLSGSGAVGGSGLGPHKLVADEAPYKWIRSSAPKKAVFASHPNFIDGMQLIGERRAFITYETAHPFYDAYWRECVRRIEISLRAYYARNREEFLRALGEEKIDYFVFVKKSFARNPKGVITPTIFSPLDKLEGALTSDSRQHYFGESLLKGSAAVDPAFIVYRSKRAIVVDVAALRASASQ